MSENFEAIADDFHKHFITDANRRLNCGIDDRLGELPDPSLAASEATRASAKKLLERLEGLDKGQLDFDTQLDVDLASLMLRFDMHDHGYRFNGKTQREQMPKAGSEIGDGIFLLFINDPRPGEARLADIVGRLEAGP